MSKDYKYSDLTYKIIGCAMEVHKNLSNGFQEKIYQKALEIEFQSANLNFIREMEIPIFYKDEVIGYRRVDFFVDNSIIVEIKALSDMEDLHLAQTLNYLEITRHEVALLINFGSSSLQFKRVANSRLKN